METLIITLFNLSLADRLFVIERLLDYNKNFSMLPMEQLEHELQKIVESSRVSEGKGQVK